MRQYLLGGLEEVAEERVEARLLSDDDYFKQMEIVENILIDEYVHGARAAGEREQMERRFLRSPERQHKLAFAQALRDETEAHAARPDSQTTAGDEQTTAEDELVAKDEESDASAPGRRRPVLSAYLKIAAAVVAAVSVGIMGWWLTANRSPVPQAMDALNTAFKDRRLVEARISEINYAPFRRVRGGEEPQVDYASRNLAERLLLEAISARPDDADSRHALGRLYLAEGKVDWAQEQFELALAKSRDDARLHGDLGVALMERGEAVRQEDPGRSFEYFGNSLAQLNRALELDGSLPEALFNRALLYQHMMLPRQAREAWRAYLEKDSASPWADEARRNLKLLEEQDAKTSRQGERLYDSFADAYRADDAEAAWAAVSRGRSRSGNLVVEQLLDEYLDQAESGRDVEAAERMRMLSYAAGIEAGRASDRYTSDLAAVYSRAGGEQRRTLARARQMKQQGVERYNNSEFEAAIALFGQVAEAFARAGDVGEALLAESWIGYCELRIPQTERSRRRFERLSAVFEERDYKSLLAQSLHALGDARTSEDELSQALDYAGRALKVSEQIQDDVTKLRCLQLFVSMHLKFGNYVESLKYSRDAMGLAQSLPFDPKLVWTFYHEAALDFYWLGLSAAALEFETEALRLAEESKWPVIISRSHSRLGVIHESRRDYDAAIRSGLHSVEAGQKIEGMKSRLSVLSHASLRLGHLYRQAGHFDRALASYDEATAMFESLGLGIYLYEVRKGRFLALSASGNYAAAGQELTEALRLFEEYRVKILEERNRNAFFDAGQDTYDLATDFAYTKSLDELQAFDYAETSRARSLLNLLQTSTQVSGDPGTDIQSAHVTSPLTFSEIRARMPERSQLLQYAVLGDKLITWVVTSGGVKSRAQAISADELGRRITAYLRQVAEPGGAETHDSAKELYAILISPVEQWLDESGQLCIVPDKMLSHLPFGALISPETGRFMVERYSFVISPSASIFIVCTDEARLRGPLRGGGMLSVGNPSFSRQRFPQLPDLPSAHREAKRVASYYDSAPLVGASAREGRVRSGMAGAEVIHFASHYVVDERSPLLSKLMLADAGAETSPAGNSDGMLQAYEVYGMKLPRTRLVVLSACQTGVEQTLRGEGALGMARAFLSTGVPLVVASLWPVESDATAELMIKFHSYRRRDGLTSVEALRKAQQEMIRDPDAAKHRPYAWASFVAFGGYEESKP